MQCLKNITAKPIEHNVDTIKEILLTYSEIDRQLVYSYRMKLPKLVVKFNTAIAGGICNFTINDLYFSDCNLKQVKSETGDCTFESYEYFVSIIKPTTK